MIVDSHCHARIDHNPDNNEYVAECVRRFPQRLYQFADVDCMWTSTYHTTPGAADRVLGSSLHDLLQRHG
jgi:hypothetical protein